MATLLTSYADGNFVPMATLLTGLILVLCRRSRQIAVGTVSGRRRLVSFP
jgi:hypothetical protein